MTAPQDSVDAHIAHWQPLLAEIDPDIEGAVTRMQYLVRHIKLNKEATLARHDLQAFEYDTLHLLVRMGGHAGPTELATDLAMSPAAMTGRLDALEQRGYVVRQPSTTDRRKVVARLTSAGRKAWEEAIVDMGYEEQRVLGALDANERRQLSDLLRRVLLVAEGGPRR